MPRRRPGGKTASAAGAGSAEATRTASAARGRISAFNSNPGGTAGVKQDKIETPAGLAYFTMESGKAGGR